MRRNCPTWFQERLTQIGGFNPHGEPRFKLVWGESETMRVGGYHFSGGFAGYRDMPAIGKEKCWALMMWEPPQKHGTAYRWYKDHVDPESGLAILGEYPFKGRYRVLKKLIHRERVGEDWVTFRMEPTHFILEVMVPMLRAWNRLNDEERLRHTEAKIEARAKEADRIMADSLHDKKIRRDAPMVQKRLELMERTMNQAMAIASRTQLGMMQMGV